MNVRFVWVILFIFSGCATLPEHYIAVTGGETLNLAEILKRTEKEKVLFVGEEHTNESDHLFQLEVIKHLKENGKELTIALELFPFERQEILDKWFNGSMEDYDFEMECDAVWDMLYSYYGKIFEYAKESNIRVFGIGAERAYINNVAMKGLNVVPEEKLKMLNFTGCKGDMLYEKLMASIEAKGMHEARLPFFCDAQRLNEAIMAYKIAGLLKKNNHTVVVLLGAAHASKMAVPEMLRNFTGVEYKVLMPGNFRDLAGKDIDKDIADYIWF